MDRVERISDHAFALHMTDGRVFTLSNRPQAPMDSLLWQSYSRNWELYPHQVGGYRVIPYGHDNLLPSQLREVVNDNNLAPGIIERQMGLLYGQGVFLNELGYVNGEITRLWREDREIQGWLDGWDYLDYIKRAMTDYLYLKGFFDVKYLERGHRIGRPARIAFLKHIPAKNARLEWTDSREPEDVRHILVGDFEHGCVNTGIRRYPVYDRRNPGRYGTAASYNCSYTFSRDFYSVPSYWGALRWIVRGSEIPTIFKRAEPCLPRAFAGGLLGAETGGSKRASPGMDGCRGGKGYFGTERNVLAKPDGGVVGKGERGEIFPYGGCAGRDDGNGIYMENRGDRSEDKRFCGFAAADFGGFVVGDHFGHGAAPVAVERDGEREAGFGFGVVVRL